MANLLYCPFCECYSIQLSIQEYELLDELYRKSRSKEVSREYHLLDEMVNFETSRNPYGVEVYRYTLRRSFRKKLADNELLLFWTSESRCPRCESKIKKSKQSFVENIDSVESGKTTIAGEIKKSDVAAATKILEGKIKRFEGISAKNTIRSNEQAVDLTEYLQKVLGIESAIYAQKKYAFDLIYRDIILNKQLPLMKSNMETNISDYASTENGEKKINEAEGEYAQGVLQLKSEIEDDYKKEIDEAIKSLKELIVCKTELYSLGILHPKYQGLIPVGIIFDYLQTGRAETLTGPLGAYNLYESEAFSRAIVEKLNKIDESLSVISESLNDIKGTQSALYKKLEENTKELKQLNKRLDGIGKAVDSILLNADEMVLQMSKANNRLEEISQNTYATAYYSARSAYNTEKIAHYAKITAQLTDALGFMMALK